MCELALNPSTVACINGLLASSEQATKDTGFDVDEIVEIFESLMPEPGQRVEPVWSTRMSSWEWRPYE